MAPRGGEIKSGYIVTYTNAHAKPHGAENFQRQQFVETIDTDPNSITKDIQVPQHYYYTYVVATK